MAWRKSTKQTPRVLAIASGGGHWVQLLRLRPAFEGAKVTFVSTNKGYQNEVLPDRLLVVRDANRWNKIALAIQMFQVAWIVLRVRPNVVVSTGASVGYFAIRASKLVRARSVWIDSIANAEELSLTGKLAGPHVDLWLTQWPELATDDGPQYAGAVL